MHISMTRRSFGRLLIVIALLAAASWAAWHVLAPVEVVVTTPVRGPAVQAIYATGTVEAGVTVRLSPRVPGKLVELLADEGQTVKAGQVLARLDDRDLKATVNELQARADYARERQQRLRDLRQKGFATHDQLQQAEADVQATRAALSRAQEQRGFMSIRAPDDGKIIKRDGEVGDFLQVTQTLFYLATTNAAPRIEAEVDEEDIAQLKLGQKALISSSAYPGKVFEGSVTQITPKGDPVARNYRVRIQLPKDSPLMIGMTTDVNIVVAERANALLVPAGAVFDNGVWLARDGRLLRQPVKIGAKGAERTEILEGLSDNDRVVTQPTDTMKAGMRVKTVPVAGTTK